MVKVTKTAAKSKKNTERRFIKLLPVVFGAVFVLFGVTMLVLPPLVRHFSVGQQAAPVVLPDQSKAQTVPAGPNVIEGKPVSLSIPSVNIMVPVTDGVFNTKSKTWTLTLDKAQYAVMTVEPNNIAGNTFIYGHNRREVFNRLPNIKAGATATIQTDNGHTFTYVYTNSTVTNPNDVSLFNYQGPPTLTLQTCTGAFYQNRQLFTFALEKVS